MTYQQTLNFMYAQLPMYHRIGAAAYKADIQPTIDFMAHLGNPERKFKSIHVAGTNGKGSVSHFLASVLQEAGLKVGLYTSPHLVDFRERIRINGNMIAKQQVVDFVEKHSQAITDLKLSFFEMTVGMAFDAFAKQGVDVAVVEVGMGGRLDSTNVITPLLSVITNIGFDHTQFLGNTLPAIAGEKAGTIKPNVPVVIGETQPETAPVFIQTAARCNSPISFADQHHSVQRIEDYTTELTGEYQKHNLATVLEAIDVLRRTTTLPLAPDAVARGLQKVVTNTHLQGRWQTICNSPLTICETAHNADGIRAMVGKLSTMQYRVLHIIYGCVSDKDYIHILQFLQKNLAQCSPQIVWHFTQPTVQRALPVAELHAAAKSVGIEGEAFDNVDAAIQAAQKRASTDDLVLVTGSIFLVADALAAAGLGGK